jgi:probable DNA metabolism protein
MLTVRFDGSFQAWRSRARALLQSRVAPHEVNWASDDEATGLFDDPSPALSAESGPRIRVPRQLLDELEMAARYRTEQRWSLLYRVLWRVSQGDSSARMVGDIDGSELHGRIKAVRREAHHLHAFLRFSPLESNLPVRFWKNLPEGMLIPQLMSRARAGAQRDGQAERVAARSGKRIGRDAKQPD